MTPEELWNAIDALDASYFAFDDQVRTCSLSPMQSLFPFQAWEDNLRLWASWRDGNHSAAIHNTPERVQASLAQYASTLQAMRSDFALQGHCAHVLPTPTPVLLNAALVPPVAAPGTPSSPTRAQGSSVLASSVPNASTPLVAPAPRVAPPPSAMLATRPEVLAYRAPASAPSNTKSIVIGLAVGVGLAFAGSLLLNKKGGKQ